MKTNTIGQLARAANVPITTIRFYERRGLLKPDARTPSNYRAYSPHTTARLKFIRAAQANGFSLGDIGEMLTLTASDRPPCGEMSSLIRHRLAEVRERLRELRRVERTLIRSERHCCKTDGADWCTQVQRLGGRTKCP